MLLRVTNRIQSRRFWHVAHWLIDRDWFVWLAARGLDLAARRDETRRTGLLNRFRALCVDSGWPGHPPTWVNLDFARLEWRLRRGRSTTWNLRRTPRDLAEPLRVGLLGQLSKLNFAGSPEFVGAGAKRFEVHVFDVEHRGGQHAGYLERVAASYHSFPTASWVDDATRSINDAQLDLLLMFELHSVDGGEVLDRIDTPCVVHLCTGSEPLHDTRVSFQLQDQPIPDYFVRDDRIFCTMCGGPFSDQIVYDHRTFFAVPDRPSKLPSWSEREPLVVFHGSLFKAASRDFLDVIHGLLRDDQELRFVLFGKDESFGRTHGSWLGDILEHAERAGVRNRVEYRGEYAIHRSEDGTTRTDAGWADARDHLLRARLAPDPWPLGGGSARAEAYAHGAPGVHMRARFDRASWGRPQLVAAEIERLLVAEASAVTVDEYARIARSLLYDENFANDVARRQLDVLEPMLDYALFWDDLQWGYDQWAASQRRHVQAAI